jgi:hypothetical protein
MRYSDVEFMDELKTLWREHQTQLPAAVSRSRDEVIQLVMLDSEISGWVEGFLKNGELDRQHTAILGRCYRDATLVARQSRDQ